MVSGGEFPSEEGWGKGNFPAREVGGVEFPSEEGAENRICLMFRGSGLGDVQNSNSEHLRGTEYRNIHRIEANS